MDLKPCRFNAAFCTSLFLFCVSAVHAQQYPTKPIRILVGFAAGGPSDVGARTIAQKLTEKWGQPVIVDFRPGAAGNIATDMAAKAPADGYTLIAAAFAHAVNPALYAKLPFDATKDFTPVLLFASIANLLVVHPSIPARSVKELIALAKTRPDQLTIGSAGAGTSSHLSGELMKMMGGVKITTQNLKIQAVDAERGLLGGNGIVDAEHVRIYSIGPEDSPHRALARYVQRVAGVYVPSHTIRLMAREDRFGRDRRGLRGSGRRAHQPRRGVAGAQSFRDP